MITTDKYVFFYTEWLSNFCKTSFVWEKFGESNHFFCTEQAFMWAKAKTFGDDESAKKILAVKDNPMECKKLGRGVKNYDDAEWAKVRYDIMVEVNYARFSQDLNLLKKILNPDFDGKTFVEASPYDGIWGIRLGIGIPEHVLNDEKNWEGTNLLGKALTEVRQMLKDEQV